MEWFNSLDSGLQTYWIIAGIASLVFVIQTIMTFVGMDASSDFDANFEHGEVHADASYPFFSIRNLINFFLGFGWGGVCFYNTFESKFWIAVVAVLTGIVLVFVFVFIFKQMLRLRRDNTFKISETVGKTANVYLVIPENKSGKGKIQISVRGAFHEIDAQTEGERIPTGATVLVDAVVNSQTVLVSKNS
ncbi:MAG: serine protease [Dysgonamonadaceae bacterium]|jgi:uncharacterized membrane protein|nr:serine protease [Dysgonamonadaceae bacterium]